VRGVRGVRGMRGNRRFTLSLLLITLSRCHLSSVSSLLLSTRLRRLKLRARPCKLELEGRELRLERPLELPPL
jgi:hypothetical protein